MNALYTKKNSRLFFLVFLFLIIYSLGFAGNGIENYSDTYVSGTITSDETWTLAGSPYIVTSTVTVESGILLTIEPGVTVKFNAGQSMYVRGTIIATEAVFTSNNGNPAAGDWGNIQVGDGSNSVPANVILNSCKIYYATKLYVYRGEATLIDTDLNNFSNHGVQIESSGTLNMSGGNIITDSELAVSGGSGIFANSNASSSLSGVIIQNFQNGIQLNPNSKVSITDINIANCVYPIVYNGSADLSATGTNSFAGNSMNFAWVNFNSLSDTIHLPGLNIPYYFNQGMNVTSSGRLEVESGNILKFADGTSLTINGSIDARAIDGDFIYFTSFMDDNWGGDTNNDGSATAPSPGAWVGIRFEDTSDDASCILLNCKLRFAGAGNVGGISMFNASPAIEGNELTSNYIGIYMQYASNPELKNNLIGSCQMTPIAMSFEANPVMTDNIFSFTDNAYDAIGLIGGTLTSSAMLKVKSVTDFPNITYLLLEQVNIPSGTTLTIERGITIKSYTHDKYWYPRRIVVDGSLIANGSIDSMITFTSARDDSFGYPGDTNKDGTITSPAVGNWGGIIFNPGSTGLLNNCRIKYADTGNFQFMNCSQTENLISSGVALIDASPTISNCEFKDLNFGITCYMVSNPELSNNKMINITGTPIAISGSSNPSFSGNIYTNVGWRAIGLLGGNVCQNGIIKKRDEAGFTNISYVLISDMTINQEASVTVEEGVVIKVNGCNIYIDGGFKTNGTTGKYVTFTSLKDDNAGNPLDTNGDGNATSPESGNWGSIKFRSSSNDEFCKLINTNLKYGGSTNEGGITFENSSAQITDILITNTSNYGVYCNGNSAPVINNTTIQNCSLDPVAMSLTSNPLFSNITFISNSSKAIKIIEGTLSSEAILAPRNIAGITNIAYIVKQLIISENAKLIIQPGVVIKFRGEQNYYPAYTYIKVYGTLVAEGAASNKIYFTSYADDSRGGDSNNDGNSSSPNKGDWGSGWTQSIYWLEKPGGIVFVNTDSNVNNINSMNNCEISYAGTGLRFENAYAKIDACSIQLANYHGVSIVGSANPEISNCLFNNINYSPVLLSMFSNPTFINCSAYNVGYMAFSVIPETYSQSATIPVRNFGGFENISYLLINPCTVNSGTTITIPKGIVFKSTSGITTTETQYVSSSGNIANGFIINGRLNIQGTTEEPVIFTNAADDKYGNPKDMNQDGSASTPPPIGNLRDYWGYYYNYWNGDWLMFNDVSDDLSTLYNVVFEYGNNAITTLSSSPIINNSVFENLICGVNLNGVSEPKIDNCVFNNLQYYPLQISLVSYPASSINNVISGSTYKVIKVRDETLTQDVTLPKRNFGGINNIPYYFNSYTIGTSASLTVEPGVVCKFESFYKVGFYPNINIFKGLNAIGGSSPDSNIVFTSIKDDFYGGDSNSDKSATSPSSGDWGGLKFENESLDPLCKFENCIFRFAEKSIHTNSSSPSFENCNITSNNYGVYVTAASNPVFKDCDFSDNYHFAINNVDKSFEIDARDCWWGNNLGPIQSNSSRNGAGTQEFVTDAVNYTPWKTMGAGNPLTGDVSLNGIVQAYDASLILKYVVGSLSLNDLQQMVADVSGEAGVSAFDASLILQYVVGTRQSFPAELKKAVLTENINSQLIVGNAVANNDQEIHIPLTVLNVSGLQAAEIRIQYDPLNIRCNRVMQIVSGMNMVFRNDSINGIITIAMAGINPLKSDTVLAEIVFQSISSSMVEIKNDLIVNRFIANETDLTAQAINGSIVIYNNPTEALYTTEVKAGLISVFPNPSSGSAFIEYQLNKNAKKVLIELFNLSGQKVRILVNEAQIRGKYLLDITEYCSSLESGSYFIRMKHEGISQSQKFLIVR